MKDLAIYGASGLGCELACMVNLINKKVPVWNLTGFFDDSRKIGESNEYGSILGGIEKLNLWNKPLNIAFAVSSPKLLTELIRSITNPLLNFPNIISPDTIFWDNANLNIGIGNVIFPRCIMGFTVSIGNFNFLNSMTSIGHDVIIGNYNVFMTDIRISGHVEIGNENFFGVSSTVLQNIKIGNNTNIGANSLIIRKTKDDNTYIGCPATTLKY